MHGKLWDSLLTLLSSLKGESCDNEEFRKIYDFIYVWVSFESNSNFKFNAQNFVNLSRHIEYYTSGHERYGQQISQ